MKKIFILVAMLLLVSTLHGQECLTEVKFIPTVHKVNPALKPDSCTLKAYDTKKILLYSPIQGYYIYEKTVRIVLEKIIDKSCKETINIISQDTILTNTTYYPEQPDKKTGNYWTIKVELMREAPIKRPENFYSTKLPSGIYEGYWVTHYGKYQTADIARRNLIEFKKEHPEFCRAYIYLLPENCEFQFQYIEIHE